MKEGIHILMSGDSEGEVPHQEQQEIKKKQQYPQKSKWRKKEEWERKIMKNNKKINQEGKKEDVTRLEGALETLFDE